MMSSQCRGKKSVDDGGDFSGCMTGWIVRGYTDRGDVLLPPDRSQRRFQPGRRHTTRSRMFICGHDRRVKHVKIDVDVDRSRLPTSGQNVRKVCGGALVTGQRRWCVMSHSRSVQPIAFAAIEVAAADKQDILFSDRTKSIYRR